MAATGTGILSLGEVDHLMRLAEPEPAPAGTSPAIAQRYASASSTRKGQWHAAARKVQRGYANYKARRFMRVVLASLRADHKGANKDSMAPSKRRNKAHAPLKATEAGAQRTHHTHQHTHHTPRTHQHTQSTQSTHQRIHTARSAHRAHTHPSRARPVAYLWCLIIAHCIVHCVTRARAEAPMLAQ